MLRTILKTTLPLCAVILAACTTSSEPKRFTPMSLENDQTAVYVYRSVAMANALYTPDLYINEEFKLAVKNGSNSRIPLPAGEYNFELKADDNQSSKHSLLLNLKPDTTYYLRVNTTLKIKSATDYEPYQRRYNLENISEKQAKIEIAECCSSDSNERTVETKLQPVTEQSDDGFSVDKTQNPFSK